MKELSLNILDVVENSVKAGATLTEISIEEIENRLILVINDDGCGMSEEVLKSVTDPFYTTRTTRKVGLGVPLLKLACEQTGGSFEITSQTQENHGTRVTAQFFSDSIDFTPLGDIVSSILTLIQGHPDTNFLFVHRINDKIIQMDTREIRKILEGIPLNTYEVIKWIEEYLKEQYENL